MFVLLAIAFALGFVVFGVGSGSTGISDALQNALNFGGSGGTSIGSLEKKAAKHPQDAATWRSLATAYEQKQRTRDAVNALERFTALRPKNSDALGELAAQYTTLAQTYYTDAVNAQQTALTLAPSTSFAPAATSALGRAFASTTGLQNPIDAAVQSVATEGTTTFQTNLTTTETLAVSAYQRLAKLSPRDATTQLQLAQAAQTAGQNSVALAAYRKFLALAPTDPLASQVKKVVKALAKTAGSS